MAAAAGTRSIHHYPHEGHDHPKLNPLLHFHIFIQVLSLTGATVLFLLRCFVRLGFGRLKRQWILEDSKWL
jgi:hypothetical protein